MNEQNPTEQDWVRGYWRSVIFATLSHELVFQKAIVWITEFPAFLHAHHDTLWPVLAEVLDKVHGMEVRTGQRTRGMQEYVITECRRIAIGYKPTELRLAA